MAEVRLTIIVDDQGSARISAITGDLERLKSTAGSTGAALNQASQSAAAAGSGFTQAGQAAAQGARGMDQSGKSAENAGINYQRLGESVAMAQAKLVAMYAAVRGSISLFEKGMESIDFYEKAIIRMSASATDSYANLNKGIKPDDLAKYYDQMKAKFGDLVNYTAVASSKYFANAREMLQVMEFATARGMDVSKKGVDQIGMMVDKVKQLVPWIHQEGQVLQEVNALWEGHARITDTWARDLVSKLQ